MMVWRLPIEKTSLERRVGEIIWKVGRRSRRPKSMFRILETLPHKWKGCGKKGRSTVPLTIFTTIFPGQDCTWFFVKHDILFSVVVDCVDHLMRGQLQTFLLLSHLWLRQEWHYTSGACAIATMMHNKWSASSRAIWWCQQLWLVWPAVANRKSSAINLIKMATFLVQHWSELFETSLRYGRRPNEGCHLF